MSIFSPSHFLSYIEGASAEDEVQEKAWKVSSTSSVKPTCRGFSLALLGRIVEPCASGSVCAAVGCRPYSRRASKKRNAKPSSSAPTITHAINGVGPVEELESAFDVDVAAAEVDAVEAEVACPRLTESATMLIKVLTGEIEGEL
ncbi:hypothetical protein CBOM_06581 [Ceraceosorus bombacis]|uniref:Uncharacterized protein n=1 Tax=Ceraceosorus bombacis TaxID=401625 RepID=A0A0P1BKD6_9BASI|nr:hypothetical protein CBOM_06581 [Ceraceosorus bombacis]